ncbi:MAG: hypothetical protein GX241_02485 [Ruminococcaceae bacterium]|nr:hypothetical protein [Oscillospiraceae bacterium]
MDLIKKIFKIISKIVSLALFAVLGYLIYAMNPWNMPAIFKRNYPEWFEAHPFISSLISID